MRIPNYHGELPPEPGSDIEKVLWFVEQRDGRATADEETLLGILKSRPRDLTYDQFMQLSLIRAAWEKQHS